MSGNGELKNVPTIKARAWRMHYDAPDSCSCAVPQAYKNPDFLGAATSRHVRIMCAGSTRAVAVGTHDRDPRCELYEPMQRLDKHDISNYFIIASWMKSSVLAHAQGCSVIAGARGARSCVKAPEVGSHLVMQPEAS